MKIIDVKKKVESLGFVSSLDSEEKFIHSVSLGLSRIYATFPLTVNLVLPHYPQKNQICKDAFETVRVSNSKEYSADFGKAYSFFASGKGIAKVMWFNSSPSVMAFEVLEEIVISSKANAFFSGFIKRYGEFVEGKVKLLFTTSNTLTVKRVAIYANPPTDSVADVEPYGLTVDYALYDYLSEADKTKISGVKSLNKLPVKVKNGLKSPIDFAFANGVLTLKKEDEGEIELQLCCEVKLPTTDSLLSDEIPLSSGLSELLPLIVASYVFLDEDSEKSQYYLDLYREEEARLLSLEKRLCGGYLKNVSGWA